MITYLLYILTITAYLWIGIKDPVGLIPKVAK
jgi:hypothetical protein